MHRSRIGVILIDHPDKSYDASSAFWRGAVGPVRRPSEGPPDGAYDEIGAVGTARLELQRLGAGTPSRIHLDIETDDVEAETVRLVGLGATVVAEPTGYRILTDPGGLLLCVVPIQTDAFAAEATTWP